MKEQELDHYLREVTDLERFFRDSGSSSRYEWLKNLNKTPSALGNKMPPIQLDIALEAIDTQRNFDYFDDRRMMPVGKDIVFYAHPRFNHTDEHRHSFIELIYVYSGEFTQTIRGNTFTMSKGELCILDTNTAHSIEKTGENDVIVNCLMRKNYFNAAFLSRLTGNDLFSDFFIHAIYQSKDFNEYILLHSGDNEKISQLMKDILREYFEPGMCSTEVIDSYMVILFAEMLREYRNDVNRQNYSALKNTKISDIIHYVETNFKTATLESTARHFNFDATYLSKTLKKLTGSKFMDLVHKARLGQACALLKSTDSPVNAIANEVGYSNIHFFYQIFRRHYACSPAEYRKK